MRASGGVPDPNPEMLVFSGSRSNVNRTAFPRSSSYLRSLTKCCRGKRRVGGIHNSCIGHPHGAKSITLCIHTSYPVLDLVRQCSRFTLISARSSVSCSSDMEADLSVSRLSSSALFCRASRISTETQTVK